MTRSGSHHRFSGRAGIRTVFWIPARGLVPPASQACLFCEYCLEEATLRRV